MAISTITTTSMGMVRSVTLCEEKDDDSIWKRLKDLSSKSNEIDTSSELDKLSAALGGKVCHQFEIHQGLNGI